jgi:hypothetical protein
MDALIHPVRKMETPEGVYAISQKNVKPGVIKRIHKLEIHETIHPIRETENYERLIHTVKKSGYSEILEDKKFFNSYFLFVTIFCADV